MWLVISPLSLVERPALELAVPDSTPNVILEIAMVQVAVLHPDHTDPLALALRHRALIFAYRELLQCFKFCKDIPSESLIRSIDPLL